MTTTRRSVLGLLGASGLAVATAGPAFAATSDRIPDDLRPGGAFDLFVKDQADKDKFSGSVLLTHCGRTVLARSYGMANKEKSIPNEPDTRFALASVTKLFTAVAIARLVQEGKLAYQATLSTYLTGFPDTVTIHHLLTHTSGFGDHFRIPGYQEAAAGWSSSEQVMNGTTEFIRKSTPDFQPGAGSQYSNSGFHLLGAIVQQVSGQSYYDYIRANVFRPAGMTSADFCTKPQWRADRYIAHPYGTQPSGGRADGVDDKMFIGTPAGDAFATSGDMARFAWALLGNHLLEPAFTQITLTGKLPPPPPTAPPGSPPPSPPPSGGARPRAVFQCYGPLAVLIGDQWMTGHSGGSFGESTDLQMYPDSQWVSVVLSNYDHEIGVVPPIQAMARDLITGVR